MHYKHFALKLNANAVYIDQQKKYNTQTEHDRIKSMRCLTF